MCNPNLLGVMQVQMCRDISYVSSNARNIVVKLRCFLEPVTKNNLTVVKFGILGYRHQPITCISF